MKLRTREHDGVLIIDIIGRMEDFAFEMNSIILGMLGKNTAKIVLNLEDVPYLDSNDIASLLTTWRDLTKEGIRMSIAGAKGATRQVLELTQLYSTLPMADSMEDAILILAG